MRAEANAIAQLVGPIGWTLLHSFWQGCLVWLVLRFGIARIPRPDLRVRLGLAGLAGFLVMQVATLYHCLRGMPAPATGALALTSRGMIAGVEAPTEGAFGDVVRFVDPWIPLFVAGWTIWTIYRLAACARGVRRTQRMLEAADPLPEPLLGRLQRLAARVGVRVGTVRFVAANITVGPGTIGWLRPFIFVPPALLLTMSPAQIEAIVAHELAHVLRRDYLLAAIQFAIEGFYTCNPFVRWIVARLNDDVELACDRVALRHVTDPVGYANALRVVAEEVVRADRLVMAATGGSIVSRVRLVLRPPSSERAGSAWTMLGVALASVAVLLALSTSALATASATRSEARFLAERTLGEAVDSITGYDGDIDAVRRAAAATLARALPADVDRSITLLADGDHLTPPQFRTAYATLDEVGKRGTNRAANARIERFLLHVLGVERRDFADTTLGGAFYRPETYARLDVTTADARRLFNATRYDNDRGGRATNAMGDLDAVLASKDRIDQAVRDLAFSRESLRRLASLARGQNDASTVARFADALRDAGNPQLAPMLAELTSPTTAPSRMVVVTLPKGTKIVSHSPPPWSKTEAPFGP